MSKGLPTLPLEIIKTILSQLSISTLQTLQAKYEEYSFFNHKDFLDMVAINNSFPYANSLQTLVNYEEMLYDDKLEEVTKQGDISSIERIMKVSPYYKSNDAFMVRNWAATYGHLHVVSEMIQRYKSTDRLSVVLENASEAGHIDIVKMVLTITKFDDHSLAYALSCAIEKNHQEIINLLVSIGADMNMAQEFNR